MYLDKIEKLGAPAGVLESLREAAAPTFADAWALDLPIPKLWLAARLAPEGGDLRAAVLVAACDAVGGALGVLYCCPPSCRVEHAAVQAVREYLRGGISLDALRCHAREANRDADSAAAQVDTAQADGQTPPAHLALQVEVHHLAWRVAHAGTLYATDARGRFPAAVYAAVYSAVEAGLPPASLAEIVRRALPHPPTLE